MLGFGSSLAEIRPKKIGFPFACRFRAQKRYFRQTSSRSTNHMNPKALWNVFYPSWATGLTAAVSLGCLYWFTFPPGAGPSKRDEDEAKLAYLSCLGEQIDIPMPTEECPISFVPNVPPPIKRDYSARLRLDMNTSIRQVPIDATHTYEIWSFNGGTPGPFIRARQGDVLDVSFTNNDETGMWHNIDFHAVSGPGGGAGVLTAEAGVTRSAQFQLLYPGLFIYHCAVDPVAYHIANGMYGLMLVEPPGGLPPVDREYAVIQSEFYTDDSPEPGSTLLGMNDERLMNEQPNYVVFNGRVGSLISNYDENDPEDPFLEVKGPEGTDKSGKLAIDKNSNIADSGSSSPSVGELPLTSHEPIDLVPPVLSEEGRPLLAKTGERVRIFFGNVGPNLVSSFHVIGSLFDKVYREGDLISPPARVVQTTLVPSGGATVVELVPTTPGTLTLVDHSIVRVEKGCVGFMRVVGPTCPKIFHSDSEARPCKPCKIHP